jgi:hypothetical protein
MADSLEKGVHIPELYDLNHRHDKELYNAENYKDKILERSLSKNIYQNNKTAGFLDKLQPMVVQMITSNVILRNWFNWTVSKYYDRHNN